MSQNFSNRKSNDFKLEKQSSKAYDSAEESKEMSVINETEPVDDAFGVDLGSYNMVVAVKRVNQPALNIVEDIFGKRVTRIAVDYRQGDQRCIGTTAINNQNYNLKGVITNANRYLGASNEHI